MPDKADPAYGQTTQPCPLKAQQQSQNLTWIEIELIGEDDQPRPGERYRILLPDGSASEGTLDGSGMARVDNIDPGTCVVTFPDLDQGAWQPIEN